MTYRRRIGGLLTTGVVLSILLGASQLFYGVKLTPGSFEIRAQNNDLVIQWKTDLEDDLLGFELFRKTPFSNGFQAVGLTQTVIPAHGVAKPYVYRDTQVYKAASEQVDYRLEAVYLNGAHEILQTKSVNYTPTAVRRTWGSIKAMFQ